MRGTVANCLRLCAGRRKHVRRGFLCTLWRTDGTGAGRREQSVSGWRSTDLVAPRCRSRMRSLHTGTRLLVVLRWRSWLAAVGGGVTVSDSSCNNRASLTASYLLTFTFASVIHNVSYFVQSVLVSIGAPVILARACQSMVKSRGEA